MADLFDTLIDGPESRKLFDQERAILEVTELICRTMQEQNVSKAELAKRLGKSKAYITQLLDGRANMTVRTISDVLFALGKSLRMEVVDTTSAGGGHPGLTGDGHEPRKRPLEDPYRGDSVPLIRTENLVSEPSSRSRSSRLRLIA